MDAKDIFSLARISCSVVNRDYLLGDLYQLGLLEFPKKNDNLSCRVIFLNEDGKRILFISDFRELGYEYLAYLGQNFIHCSECGILVRGNTNGTKTHCSNCVGYKPMGSKSIVCADCGITFEVNSKDSKTCRCKECYTQYRRKYKAEKERERRGSRMPDADVDSAILG